MTPTAKLRFVERKTDQWVFDRMHGSEACYKQKVLKVLQQWWENRNMRLAVQAFDEYGTPIARYQGEWRDVPLEEV